jgi:hypothetical protein
LTTGLDEDWRIARPAFERAEEVLWVGTLGFRVEVGILVGFYFATC